MVYFPFNSASNLCICTFYTNFLLVLHVFIHLFCCIYMDLYSDMFLTKILSFSSLFMFLVLFSSCLKSVND